MYSENKSKESKDIEANCVFKQLKYDIILNKIYDNIKKKRVLEIIKYNKDIQKRLNLSVNDYKEFSENYSSIEMEVIPTKNATGKFIIISDEDKPYYHIYFNEDKTEVKTYELPEGHNVSKIKIIIDYQVTSLEYLFEWIECIEYISFKKFFRNNIIKMNSLFFGCGALKEIDLSHFRTDNVIDISTIFYRCALLKEINLSNFDTSKVKTMSGMFYGCSSLTELDVSKFNTDNVEDMSAVFYNCSSLKELKLSNFNTSNAETMIGMFYGCSSLKELNLSNFDTNNVVDMSMMFFGCTSLEELNIANFNTDNLLKVKLMFHGCSEELKKKMIALNKFKQEEAFV